jgi:hypothetical protein
MNCESEPAGCTPLLADKKLLAEPGTDDSTECISALGLECRIVTHLDKSTTPGSTGSLKWGRSPAAIGTTSDATSPHNHTRCRSAADCRHRNSQASAASAIASVDLMTISPSGRSLNAEINAEILVNSFI